MECSSYRVEETSEITFTPLLTGKGEIWFLERLLNDYLNFEIVLAEEKSNKRKEELLKILGETEI